MKQTTLCVAATLTVFVLLLQPPTVKSSQIQRGFNQWINRLRDILRIRSKKDCVGYMCSYHHMGSAAASRSKHKALMRYLQNCARDPMCSPGKRRKRSEPNLLQQAQQSTYRSSLMLKNIFPRIYEQLLKRNRKENVKSDVE